MSQAEAMVPAASPAEKIEYYPPPVVLLDAVYYPESDGKPMAETDTHRDIMVYLIEALRDFFRDDPQVYVAGNLFVYYEEGDPTQVVAPDVFVVKGVPRQKRRTYKVWEEGKGPDVVIEVSSRKTRREDLGPKKGTYEMMGVQEYYLFDPLGEYLETPLVSYRLTEEGYRPLKEEWPVSEVLGLTLRVEEGELRLYDPTTGEKLLTPLEAHEAHRREAKARRQAEARTEAAEAELARLRAELDHLRDE